MSQRTPRPFAYAALCLAAALAAFAAWPVDCLCAQSEGRLLFAWPIRAGEAFELTFTHSLNLSPITDVIEWTGRDLSVVKSVFTAFGAGVPVPADGIGTDIVRVGDHYELIGIDQHMPSVTILTQTVPNHRVALNRRAASLLDLVGPGKPVELSVKRISWFWVRVRAMGYAFGYALFYTKKLCKKLIL